MTRPLYFHEYQDRLFAALAEQIPITGGWLRGADVVIESGWGIIETIEFRDTWTPPAGWRETLESANGATVWA